MQIICISPYLTISNALCLRHAHSKSPAMGEELNGPANAQKAERFTIFFLLGLLMLHFS